MGFVRGKGRPFVLKVRSSVHYANLPKRSKFGFHTVQNCPIGVFLVLIPVFFGGTPYEDKFNRSFFPGGKGRGHNPKNTTRTFQQLVLGHLLTSKRVQTDTCWRVLVAVAVRANHLRGPRCVRPDADGARPSRWTSFACEPPRGVWRRSRIVQRS